MAGMQRFRLFVLASGAYCRFLAVEPLLLSPTVKLPAVPLWKVIVGPRAGKL